MKKFRPTIIALLIVVLTIGTCFAESIFEIGMIPFSELSIDELLAIEDRVHEELTDRRYLSDEILEGVYIAGKDIAIGSFVFYMPEKYGDDSARLFLYQSMDDYKAHKYIASPFVSDETGVSIILEEGYVLDVAITRCACHREEVKRSWAQQ